MLSSLCSYIKSELLNTIQQAQLTEAFADWVQGKVRYCHDYGKNFIQAVDSKLCQCTHATSELSWLLAEENKAVQRP